MKTDLRILEELKRYNQINKYINEQELPPAPEGEIPVAPGGEIPPAPGGEVPPTEGAVPPAPDAATGAPVPPTSPLPEPIDTESDPDVEKLGDEKKKGNKEEIEVTDLVKGQKSVEDKQDEYFESLFNHLNDLESKLNAMDGILDRLNSIETKIEKYRVKTPEEKLELRTLDSGPFNQKLSKFFEDKEEEMEASGKNEYVLTTDEVESYSPNEIKRSFRDFGDTEMTPENDMSRFKKIY
jgi:hypothetical protein